MRLQLLTLVLALFSLSGLAAARDDLSLLQVRDAAGQPHVLHDLLDPTGPTLINFWATWCPPCREELPLLLHGHEAGEYNLITINLGDPVTKAETYLSQNSISALPNYFLSARQASGLPIFGMPTSLLVNEAGEVTATHPGAFSPESLTSFVTERSEPR